MTEQVAPSVIDRIQKLLALSESPNQHEAALAFRRASDLLLKHNLTRADVRDGGGHGPVGVGLLEVTAPAQHRRWGAVLVVAIAEHCFCRALGTPRGFVFIGTPENCAAAKAMFAWLCRQMAQFCGYGAPKSLGRGQRALRWRNNFCLGAAFAISRRLETARAEQMRDAAQAPGLVLAHQAANEEFIRRNIKVAKPRKPRKRRAPRINATITYGIIAGERMALAPQGGLEGE